MLYHVIFNVWKLSLFVVNPYKHNKYPLWTMNYEYDLIGSRVALSFDLLTSAALTFVFSPLFSIAGRRFGCMIASNIFPNSSKSFPIHCCSLLA